MAEPAGAQPSFLFSISCLTQGKYFFNKATVKRKQWQCYRRDSQMLAKIWTTKLPATTSSSDVNLHTTSGDVFSLLNTKRCEMLS